MNEYDQNRYGRYLDRESKKRDRDELASMIFWGVVTVLLGIYVYFEVPK